ncbi:hypothetical protein AV530_014788 [Patagioenas fasciata monilis]|uniref:Uncharacterized protein n=1 Tax=Patagioenas fasciata monilis TaxID=372326 RepID=A0A1V4L0N6_PATFA|nr:hypothetical protein AV530_014788 [Patagioenas fasciata monilis]
MPQITMPDGPPGNWDLHNSASKTLGVGYLRSQMAQGFSAVKAKVVFEGHCGFGDFRDQWDAGMAGTGSSVLQTDPDSLGSVEVSPAWDAKWRWRSRGRSRHLCTPL